MILETDRLILRSPHFLLAKGVQRFYDRNQEHLKPWEPQRPPGFYTFEAQLQDLSDQAKAFRNGVEYRFWILEKNAPRILIGSVVLSAVMRGNFQSCFMGYKMDESKTGRGLMTEACRRVVSFAFEEEGANLHRVEINVVPENAPSLRVAEKLGFIKEGFSQAYLNIDGVWKDHVRFAMTKERFFCD